MKEKLYVLKLSLICVPFWVVIIGACSAQWHLNHAIKKDSTIFQTDTVRTIDTVYTRHIEKDTVFRQTYDTVTITKDNLRVTYHYDSITDTVHLAGECETDTIYRTNTVVREKYIQRETPWTWLERNWYWVIGGIVILVALRLLKSYLPF